MNPENPAELLALPPERARELFAGDRAARDRRFRALAARWHPDHRDTPEAAQVFAHLLVLRDAAARIDRPLEQRLVATTDGRRFRLGWRARRPSDGGEMLLGDRTVAHCIPAELDDAAARADALLLPFADAAMEAAITRQLPRRLATLRTADGMIFVERKLADEVLLRDLMRLGPVEPRQAAWIATRLVNLTCWLQWAGLSHGAIGPDSLLVSPAEHSLALTGPFLCAGAFGVAPTLLPERTLAAAPRYAAPGALLDDRLDPELARLTVRELLGDPAGTRLLADPGFPAPFAQWLLMPTADGARTDFPAWERAREASFGARRFTPWDVDTAALMAA